MLFVSTYPQQVYKAISLDSLRMPFPNNGVPILSIRAIDTKPDHGDLPDHGVIIVPINAKHIELCDRGSHVVKRQIESIILRFL